MLITCEWVARLPCQSTSMIMATKFGRKDVLCTICYPPLHAGTHRRLLKPPSPPNESASHFCQCMWAHHGGVRAYACMPCFAKLEKGCKMIHAVQQIVSDLCSCCMFLWGDNCISWHWKAFTTSTIERKKLSPQCSIPLSSQKLRTWKQSCALHITACE